MVHFELQAPRDGGLNLTLTSLTFGGDNVGLELLQNRAIIAFHLDHLSYRETPLEMQRPTASNND